MKGSEREQKLYDVLKRISMYQNPERLKKDAKKLWGIDSEEAVEMAYENVLNEARAVIKNIKKPISEESRQKMRDARIAFFNRKRLSHENNKEKP